MTLFSRTYPKNHQVLDDPTRLGAEEISCFAWEGLYWDDVQPQGDAYEAVRATEIRACIGTTAHQRQLNGSAHCRRF